MKPLKFQPLLKSTIWGGNKIIAFKHLDVKQEKVGESWEISGVPGNESIVADGEMKGKKPQRGCCRTEGEASSEQRTTSVSAMSFHCSSSLSMPTATSLSRYILMMKLPRSKVRSAARPRCGMRCQASRMPSSTTA